MPSGSPPLVMPPPLSDFLFYAVVGNFSLGPTNELVAYDRSPRRSRVLTCTPQLTERINTTVVRPPGSFLPAPPYASRDTSIRSSPPNAFRVGFFFTPTILQGEVRFFFFCAAGGARFLTFLFARVVAFRTTCVLVFLFHRSK